VLVVSMAVASALSMPAAATGGTEFWGYIDGQGVAHLAPRALDSRYRLLLGPPGTRQAQGRVPGKTHAAGLLLTWMEFAPEVRAVQHWLREAEALHGVDAALMQALIAVESGFDARAVSPRGAVGLMQIMPATGEHYARGDEAQRPVQDRLLDPRTNIHTGARLLADLSRRYGGRTDLALAAWNAGDGRVRRAGRAVPAIDETQAHVHLVLELYWALLQRAQVPRATMLKLVSAAAPVAR